MRQFIFEILFPSKARELDMNKENYQASMAKVREIIRKKEEENKQLKQK